jgi:hypothetical protein
MNVQPAQPTLGNVQPTLADSKDVVDVEVEEALDAKLEGMSAEEMKTIFHESLDELRKEGIKEGLDKKQWKNYRKTWEASFKAHPDAALKAIKNALDSPNIAWDCPNLAGETA